MNSEKDIQKLERFLTKYFADETSAPICNENAVDIAILVLQKYHLAKPSNEPAMGFSTKHFLHRK